jgi:hypothetical protein
MRLHVSAQLHIEQTAQCVNVGRARADRRRLPPHQLDQIVEDVAVL